MLRFKHRVTDPATQMNFEQLSTMLPSRKHSLGFNLAAGAAATSNVVISEGVPTELTFVVVGSPAYIGAYAGQAGVGWAWRYLSSTQLEVTVQNNGAAAAIGILYFAIITLDS